MRDRVERWLQEHPGQHRCSEIARGIGEQTHPVAVACYGLFEQGRALRGQRPARNGGRAFKTYAAAPRIPETVGGPGDGATTNQS